MKNLDIIEIERLANTAVNMARQVFDGAAGGLFMYDRDAKIALVQSPLVAQRRAA